MKRHPYVELLKDTQIRTLWIGLALSALGTEIYRIGAIWIAVNIAGSHGSYLASSQMVAVLLMSIGSGVFIELISRRSLLIGSDLICAIFSFLVVLTAVTSHLTLLILILTSAVLAACGSIYSPTLQSSLPRLVTDRSRFRAVNGLFDATTRSAQILGPALAALLITFVPAIHLITFNGFSFIASAVAVWFIGKRLTGSLVKPERTEPSILKRLSRGIRIANTCPGAWRILLTTMVRGAAIALGFSVGIPLLFSQQPVTNWLSGISALALVFGTCAGFELLSNVILASVRPNNPWRLLFSGYLTIGAGLALIGVSVLIPFHLRVIALLGGALLTGIGNSMAGVQMTTHFSSRLDASGFASVLRLRMILITAAAMLMTFVGPFIFGSIGVVWTIIACGIAIMSAASLGLLAPMPDGANDMSRAI